MDPLFFGMLASTSTAGFRYLSLNVTGVNPAGGNILELQEITFGLASGLVPVLTSNSTPSPYGASGTGGDGFAVGGGTWYKYFDGVYWRQLIMGGPFPARVILDYGAVQSTTVTSVSLTPSETGASDPRWPISFSVSSSLTGAFAGEEKILKTWTGITTGWTIGATRVFSIP